MIGRKGFFFTVGILLLLLPLIFLVSYYISTSRIHAEDVTGKIRCDELHFFVEDVEKDMSRAVAIFGRRAAVFTLDEIVSSGVFLANYTFNCTDMCGVDCGEFKVGYNGSEAALAELTLCGTLYGSNVTYMVNHTLSEWVDRMVDEGGNMSFNASIVVEEIKIIPYDAYSFSVVLNMSFDIFDSNSLCFYDQNGITTQSTASIVGLEDPLYAVFTDGDLIKYIDNCSLNISTSNLAGTSDRGYGNGTGGGNIFLATGIPNDEKDTYCTTHNVSGLVLIIPGGFGACNTLEQACFNASTPEGDHFEAVINYGPDNPASFSEKCDITIPWISDTDDLNFSEGDCSFVKNIEGCDIHEVYNGINSNETNTTCYQVSDVSSHLVGCENIANGPSFFDRLDGNLNLTSKYTAQSLEYFGTDLIGLETLIDPYELDAKGKTLYGGATWIDYLYWQNVSGCVIPAICQTGEHQMRLDCPHTKYFMVDSSCVNGSGVLPSTDITYPINSESLDCSTAPFMVLGNASDCDDNVSYVTVKLGDDPWVNATYSAGLWNASWFPTGNGTYTITSRAVDDGLLVENPGDSITVNIFDCGMTSTTSTTTILVCLDYCINTGNYSSGTCRRDPPECTSYGEVNEAGGDTYCPGGPNDDTCCCMPGETTTTTTTTSSTSSTTSSTTSTTTTTTSTTSTTTTTTYMPTVLASEDFESHTWNGGSGWESAWAHSGDSSIITTDSPHAGSYHARLRRDTGYISREVDLAGRANATVRFWAKADSFEPTETSSALISTNGGGDWVILETWEEGDDDDIYHYYEYEITHYGLTADVIIAFDAEMSWKEDYFYIDDLEVYGG